MSKDSAITKAARALAAQRHRVEGKCEVCGRTFEGMKHRRYCRPACSAKAYRLRNPEKWRAINREHQRRRYHRLRERGRAQPARPSSEAETSSSSVP